MSKIGYIRVSTEHQETARQQEIMWDYQVDRIFSEKMSGANADRPQLKAMLDYVRDGDTLYIESISRLGRSTKDLLNIIDTLTEKGVTLVSNKENIDTDTPSGKFMLTVFAALSQLERKQLKQRQREGIEIAKAQGKYSGRKPIEIDRTRFGQLYGEWKSKNITGRDFMRRMGLSANTFYRRVREYGITVICYGLRTDFQSNLFPGARRLMELADDIEQIKTICWCGKRAHFNARIVDGQMATEGEQVQLGGNESYTALCRKHYKERQIKL